jgi:CHAT domain-containing protein
MGAMDRIRQLLDLEGDAQRRFLQEQPALWNDELATALKEQADQLLRADVNLSLNMANLLLYLAELANEPRYRALGLLAQANARSIGLGEYQQARELYDQAAAIFDSLGLVAEVARSQVGKVWPLACLGLYDEAIETGQWAAETLQAHEQWVSLATLTMNLAAVHGRQGEDVGALVMLDRARELHHRIGGEQSSILPLVEQNRAIVLRNLGRFEASIAASRQAWQALDRLGHSVEAARAQQNLAITYFVLGRYNEALNLLNQARDVFLDDGRQRDAILVDLFISDCLLQLRRFPDVLRRCREVRELFSGLGTRFEVGQTLLNEAIAYAGLGRHDEALESLAEARGHFAQEDNEVWIAASDLERATILLRRGCGDECRDIVEACAAVFRQHNLPVKEAQAYLIAARVAAARADIDAAHALAQQALRLGNDMGVPSLTYDCHHLLGDLARFRGEPTAALGEYERAIQDLEQLRGRLMIEFRIQFLEDKHAVYEDAVGICLDLCQPGRGLQYAERAKSRALLDLLAYRLDLGIEARTKADQPLVDRLLDLRAERDRIYRRWQTEEEVRIRGSQQEVQQEVLALEKQITDLWHRLLIRNGDYARDAALWQVRTEPVQPFLDSQTLLLEYFPVRDRLAVFLVDREQVEAHYLPVGLDRVRHLAELFQLNLRTLPRSRPSQAGSLLENAHRLLQALYDALLRPFHDRLAPGLRLILVPHGPLHYLPFHAFHDGRQFLLDRHEISYLPGASVLRYCRETRPAKGGLAAFGYSFEGRLPYAVEEARLVTQHLDGEAFLEGAVTSAHLRAALPGRRVLHLATHGEFRPDNPLFSGLALSDGWLTTLDIFGLHLDASLVTLSACQTGRSVVGGGDELMGLMRAFLYAGSASLVLSLWSVEDRSAAEIMGSFYHNLAHSWTKSAALRAAQLQALHSGDGLRSHPYYWAPFVLVGDPGPL